MSKQLTLSAGVSVVAMAAFALFAAHSPQPSNVTRAPSGVAAPAMEASLPGS